MFEMWTTHPGYFIALGILLLSVLGLLVLFLLRNAKHHHDEVIEALRSGRPELVGPIQGWTALTTVLSYVPWQFWMSLVILVLIIGADFVSDSDPTYRELAKYVTGAVIGSLFGTSKKLRDESAKT